MGPTGMVSECKLQGIFNIFKPWQKAVAPGVLFQAFRRDKAMRVMTFQCWCLGSSGPCWEVDQSPPKNNLHSEWFVDTSHLPPSNVPRREMPSSELGGKSIEFGPTVNLEVSTWKHQNHRVYTLDIRIMVAKYFLLIFSIAEFQKMFSKTFLWTLHL